MAPQWRRWMLGFHNWAVANRLLLASALLFCSGLPFLSVVDDRPQQDVLLYRNISEDLKQGVLPYRDRVVEYPPYSVPLFMVPHLFGDSARYSTVFKLFAAVPDLLLKCLLLWIGMRESRGLRALLPMAFYCSAVPFLKYFYLQRYDVFPALSTTLALSLFFYRKYGMAGLLLAWGTGAKLYPLLFLPPLFIWAYQDRKAWRFLTGYCLGLVPLLLLALIVPWWKFLEYHSARGIQVESLSASVLWFIHHWGYGNYIWTEGHGCVELQGTIPARVLPFVKLLFLLTVTGAVGLASLYAARRTPHGFQSVCHVLLLPLLAFVVFNQVFSPQYLVWLLPLAAVATLATPSRWAAIIFLSALLTPIVFPSRFYGVGLPLFETSVLLLRNCLLVILCGWLAVRAVRELRASGASSFLPRKRSRDIID